MALVVYDRVQETTTTTGTGTITLGGAVSGYQSFAVVGNGNTTFYCIINGSAWEVGIGTYTASGTTLARTTILSNSNGNTSAITLAGASNVFVTYPSEKSVNLDSINTATVPQLATNSTTSTTPTLSFNGANSNFAGGATVSGSYFQNLLQNKSGTAGASTNYVLSNDLGTDSTYYGEFGMNSSVFSASTPADFFSINNGIYFSGHDGDLSVGSGNGFKTYLAWGTTGQSAHVINATGALGFSTNLGTTPALSGTTGFGTSGQALVSAGSAAAPAWGTLGTAGGGTGVTTATANYVFAGPTTGAAAAPAFRALVVADIPSTYSEFATGTALLFYQATAPTGWTKSTTNDNKALRVVSGSTGGSSGGTVAFTTAFASQTPAGTVSVTLNNTTAAGTIGGNTDGTAISVAQMPAHNHGVNDPSHNHTLNDPGHSHSLGQPGHQHPQTVKYTTSYSHAHYGTGGGAAEAPIPDNGYGTGGDYTGYANSGDYVNGAGTGTYNSGAYTGITTQNNGSGTAHSHTVAGVTFTGTAHTHTTSATSFTGTAINLAVQYIDVIVATKN